MKKHTTTLVDLTGCTFGSWTVIRQDKRRRRRLRSGSPGHTGAKWLCQCSCGTVRSVFSTLLRGGHSRSCGCLNSACLRLYGVSTNAMPEGKIFDAMNRRCHNVRDDSYADYGGRGITVCDRWRTRPGYKRQRAFLAFLEDMGRRPSPDHSIDRRDNNGGYSKENCYWATYTEQANNRRSSLQLTFRGETMTLAQWCRQLSLPYIRTAYRIRCGWSVENAFTRPARTMLTPEQVSDVLRRAAGGESDSSIAAVYDTSMKSIRTIRLRTRRTASTTW